MRSFRRWLGVVVLGMFFFMVVVDGSIVTIAVPAMAAALGVGTAQVNLVIAVYLITISALLLPFGQLGDRIGRPRLFRIGTAAFLLGSGLAGAAPAFAWVLAGRVVQAIGASMTMATSYAVVTDLFPPGQLGRAFGVESIFISLGALAGPGLGGLILAQWGWREIFWVNVPLGGLCLVMAWWALPGNAPRPREAPYDWVGTGGVIVLALLFYAATVAAGPRPLVALGKLIGVALGGGLWLAWERRQAAPLLDLQLLRSPPLAVPLAASLLSFIAAYAFVLLAPIDLELVGHLDARATGLVLMAGPVVALVANPVAGVVTDRWPAPRLMRLGMVVLVVVQLALVVRPGGGSAWWLVAVAAVTAVGTAVFTTAANTRIMTSSDPAHRGAVGAVSALARELGMMIGVAVSSVVFYGALSRVTGRQVASALHQPASALVAAERGAYVLAAGLLVVALGLLMKRKRDKHGRGPLNRDVEHRGQGRDGAA
ncbi:MFS transporter [Lacticaseibacillus suihuaensis]